MDDESPQEGKLRNQKRKKRQKPNAWRKEAIGIVIMLVIAFVLAFGLSWFLKAYLDTDTPQVAVTTGSMEPVYHGYESSGRWKGDLLIVRHFSASKYKVGDVIVFDAPGQEIPIVHRIIAIYDDPDEGFRCFKTMGDNNGVPDQWMNTPTDKIPDTLGNGWIYEDAIRGRIIWRVPNVGWLALQLHETLMQLLIILAAVLLLFWGLFDSEDKDKEEQAKSSNEVDETANANSELETDSNPKGAEEQQLDSKTLKETKSPSNQSILTSWTKKIPRSVSVRLIIVLSIFTVILGFAAVQVFFALNTPRVELLGLPDEIMLTDGGAPTDSSLVRPINPGADIYMIPCDVRIRSSGHFRYINDVKIALKHSNGTTYQAYRWTIIYGFDGTKTAGAGLVLFLNTSMVGDYTISVTGHTAGILAGSDVDKTYPFTISISS
ncbi:MAG: signal peptidase I [Candidatus Heimdallarchaeota archaeon]